MSADVGEPERDPRPQAEDGTHLCYHEGCAREADLVTPRRIESTRIDPVETAVTTCLRCYCAMEVLGGTRGPLRSTVEAHTPEREIVAERLASHAATADPTADGPEAGADRDWLPLRLYARVLANSVLHDDPRGSDPLAEDSPLGDIFDHAGAPGERLRERLETPIEEQLYDSAYPDTPDRPRGDRSADLGAFAADDEAIIETHRDSAENGGNDG